MNPWRPEIDSATTSKMNATTPEPSVRLGANDHVHSVGAWRNLFWLCWHGEPLARAVSPMPRFIRKLIDDNPMGIGMLTIVEEQASPPGSDARNAIAKLFATIGDGVSASAVVFEGTGFRASLVRSVATSLTLIAKQPFPHRMFSSVEDAASWLSEQLPATNEGKATADDIVAASRMMRDASRR